MPAQYLAIGFKGTGRHRKGRFFAPLFDYAFGPSTSVDPIRGHVQTIFGKINVIMTLRGGGGGVACDANFFVCALLSFC